MRAVWLVRKNLEQHPGGDTTQILRTRAAVESQGVEVDLVTALPRDLRRYDVAHLFHLDRLWENLPASATLRAAGVPTVLSTIWWPADEFDRYGRRGMQGRLARWLGTPRYQSARLVQRWLLDRLGGGGRRWDGRLLSFRRAGRALLDACDVLLPNSVAEREAIEAWFGGARAWVIVPNAVDLDVFSEVPADTERAGVLCVGRIEPRKNQLALVRALRGMDVPVTLLGPVGRFSSGYGRAVRSAADENVRIAPPCRGAALRAAYARHAVHACVSWYETPGLASLEAGVCGCRLVVTPGGSTREYFGRDAWYCEAGDAASIRTAVAGALAGRVDGGVVARWRGAFTWSAAASQTIMSYQLSISKVREMR